MPTKIINEISWFNIPNQKIIQNMCPQQPCKTKHRTTELNLDPSRTKRKTSPRRKSKTRADFSPPSASS